MMLNQKCLLAGAAKEDATPAVGTSLYGYCPDLFSTYVHDPLSVTVLALAQGDCKVLMVTVENGGVENQLGEQIREELAKLCDIPVTNILFSCTHTHSGPNLSGIAGWGEIDKVYLQQIFVPALRKAAKRAVEEMKPAEVAVGEVESKVGVNRRQQLENGHIHLGQNPYGCYDPYMTVVSIREEESKQGILNLIHYGCHGTSAGRHLGIGRDWSGGMIDCMEKETGTITAFWNGAVGDVGPRLANGDTTGISDIRYTEELGSQAAADAMRAYRQRSGYHTELLEVFTGTVEIPNKEMPGLSEVKAKLDSYQDQESLVNLGRLEYEYYKMVYEYLCSDHPVQQEKFSFRQTLVALGDVLFVPFPFEMFSEMVMRLRAYSPYRYTLSLSNTNGYNAYLPTEAELCRGGYEVGCFKYIRVFQLVDNADQHIISENMRILRDGKKNCKSEK